MSAIVHSQRGRAGTLLFAGGVLLLVFAFIMLVSGVPVAGAAPPTQTSHYYFNFYHPSDGTYEYVAGTVGPGPVSSTNEVTLHVNGTDHDGGGTLIDMVMHLSCSDTWSNSTNAVVGGFSDGSGGPTYATHPDWEVVSYYIFKEKSAGSPEPCGDAYTTTTTAGVTTTTAGEVTTTTAGEVTTTTAGEVTTTTAGEVTTTTAGEVTTTTAGEVTTTTAGEVTTTTAGEVTTTTSGDTTTTVGGPGEPTTTTGGDITTTTGGATTTSVAGPCDPNDSSCLPNNGAGDLLAFLLGGLGLLFMGSGSLVVASERRRLVA